MSVTSTWIKLFPNGNIYLIKGNSSNEGLIKIETNGETKKLVNAIQEFQNSGLPKPGKFALGIAEEEVNINLTRPDDLDDTEFSIDSNLKERCSTLTADQINDYFRQRNSHLEGIGKAAIEASEKYGINTTYIVAHAILETGWGTSDIYKTKNNLYGYGAWDGQTWRAKAFSSREECINYVMDKINTNYLTPGGEYFKGKACLGNKSYGMNVKYASDPQWGEKIATIARQMENEFSDPRPDPVDHSSAIKFALFFENYYGKVRAYVDSWFDEPPAIWSSNAVTNACVAHQVSCLKLCNLPHPKIDTVPSVNVTAFVKWAVNHGWEKITSVNNLKTGDICVSRTPGETEDDHVYCFVSYVDNDHREAWVLHNKDFGKAKRSLEGNANAGPWQYALRMP